ncbi:hypothetical protein GCM10022389_20740 [Flavobacterium cheonanense]|uniref:Uncharacterized protein n=2 Tax=Flavobacterium cheonanense TaxID=706183 RepID=A0ABP7VXB8_9FLAO
MIILKSILKFYLYGVVMSLIIVGFIHIYGLLFDTFYAYPELPTIIKTGLLSGLPLGLFIFLLTASNKPLKTKNKYVLLSIKTATYYWFGILLGLVLIGFLQLYIFVYNVDYNYATLENIFGFSILLGIPLGILVYVLITLAESRNAVEISTKHLINQATSELIINSSTNKIQCLKLVLNTTEFQENTILYNPKLPLDIVFKDGMIEKKITIKKEQYNFKITNTNSDTIIIPTAMDCTIQLDKI